MHEKSSLRFELGLSYLGRQSSRIQKPLSKTKHGCFCEKIIGKQGRTTTATREARRLTPPRTREERVFVFGRIYLAFSERSKACEQQTFLSDSRSFRSIVSAGTTERSRDNQTHVECVLVAEAKPNRQYVHDSWRFRATAKFSDSKAKVNMECRGQGLGEKCTCHCCVASC